MSGAVQFGLLGLGAGGAYVLGALGLVIFYRTSKVVNFAGSAVGMTGTYAYWGMSKNGAIPQLPALCLGILISAALGGAMYMLVIRPLRAASQLTQIVATLAVFAILESAAALRYPSGLQVVAPIFPSGSWRLLGTRIGEGWVLLFLLSIILVVILHLFYRYTAFGRRTTAVAENRIVASSLGISVDRVAATNWAIGAGLAGASGILLAPLIGLGPAQASLLLVPALASAVVGNFSSFLLVTLGGLVIGIAGSEITKYVATPGWSGAVPFLVMLAALLLRPRRAADARPLRSERLPSVGTGALRLSVILPITAVAVIAILLLLPPTWVMPVGLQAAIAVVLLSQLLITGYAGQLSLAQYIFAGLGALLAANLVYHAGLPFEVAILVGMIGTVPLSAIIGLLGTKTRGVNLAILTLGLTAALETLVFGNQNFVGSAAGIPVGSQTFFGIAVDPLLYPRRYAVLVVVLAAVVALAVANLRHGKVGRRMLAVRANERAARALGISVQGAKVYAFVLGGVIAGLGGILVIFSQPFAIFSNFTPEQSINIVSYNVVGGAGWIAGSFVGAGLAPGALGSQILNVFASSIDNYLFLIGGILLLLTVFQAQNGLAAQAYQFGAVIARGIRRGARNAGIDTTSIVQELPDADVMPVPRKSLAVTDLTVRFGGVVAVQDLALDISAGSVTGLIGPNGAGKTTVIEAISGFVRADSGRIMLDGEAIENRPAYERARSGLGRSFQSLELFDDMTVLENLLVASDKHGHIEYVSNLVTRRQDVLSAATIAVIRTFGLESVLSRKPTELAYGQRRLVAIARSVAAAPSILMLDEPAAGLSDMETRSLGRLISALASEWGIGILLIEHHIDMVFNTCDRVYVLDQGRCIASGAPEDVRRSDKVIQAYLGDSHHSARAVNRQEKDILPKSASER